jgi:hypothetical protein
MFHHLSFFLVSSCYCPRGFELILQAWGPDVSFTLGAEINDGGGVISCLSPEVKDLVGLSLDIQAGY